MFMKFLDYWKSMSLDLIWVKSCFNLNCEVADVHSLLQVTLNIKIYCTWYVFRVKISSRLLLIRTRKLFPGFMMSRSQTFVSFLIPMRNPPSTCRNSNLCSPPSKGAGVAPVRTSASSPLSSARPSKLPLGTPPSRGETRVHVQLEM